MVTIELCNRSSERQRLCRPPFRHPLISSPFLSPFLFPPFRHTVRSFSYYSISKRRLPMVSPVGNCTPTNSIVRCVFFSSLCFLSLSFSFFLFEASSTPSPFPSLSLSLSLSFVTPCAAFFSRNDRSSSVVDEEVDRLRINAVNGTKIMVNDNGVHSAIVPRLHLAVSLSIRENGFLSVASPLS